MNSTQRSNDTAHQGMEPPKGPDHGPSHNTSIVALIGERTRALRQQHGMTRRDLSGKTDISERYLALLEKGESNVSILLLERIAHALGARLSDMVAEPGTKSAD